MSLKRTAATRGLRRNAQLRDIRLRRSTVTTAMPMASARQSPWPVAAMSAAMTPPAGTPVCFTPIAVARVLRGNHMRTPRAVAGLMSA